MILQEIIHKLNPLKPRLDAHRSKVSFQIKTNAHLNPQATGPAFQANQTAHHSSMHISMNEDSAEAADGRCRGNAIYQ